MVAVLAEVTMAFRENLRRLREAKGLTQSQVARGAGVPLRSYQNWEIGEREPRLDALVKLAVALDTTTDELLEGMGTELQQPELVVPVPLSPIMPRGKRK